MGQAQGLELQRLPGPVAGMPAVFSLAWFHPAHRTRPSQSQAMSNLLGSSVGEGAFAAVTEHLVGSCTLLNDRLRCPMLETNVANTIKPRKLEAGFMDHVIGGMAEKTPKYRLERFRLIVGAGQWLKYYSSVEAGPRKRAMYRVMSEGDKLLASPPGKASE
jgi:hypothetical protein